MPICRQAAAFRRTSSRWPTPSAPPTASSSFLRNTITPSRARLKTRSTGCPASATSRSRTSRSQSNRQPAPPSAPPVADWIAPGGALGGARMQYHMRMALTFLNAFIFGTPEVFVGMAQTKFDEKTLALKDEPTRKIVAQQLTAFEAFIARVKG